METTLVWVDREGREEAISAPPNDYVSVRLSPDGQQIAAALLEKGNADVFAFDVARSTLTRITFDPGNDNYVSWSPDGQRISFASNRGGQINPYWARVDGTGEVEPLATHPGITVVHSWSPDGTTAVLTDLNPETGENIGVLDVDERRINWILSAAHDESPPAISPNGRWMAYTSNESGRLEVYVRPFPNVNDGRWRISTDGGLAPLWGPDSDELFFQTASGTDGETAVMAVRLDTEPTLVPGNPRRLLAGPYRLFVPLLANTWDISKDGQRFLMIKNNTDALAAGRDTIIVQHWIEELKRLVPID